MSERKPFVKLPEYNGSSPVEDWLARAKLMLRLAFIPPEMWAMSLAAALVGPALPLAREYADRDPRKEDFDELCKKLLLTLG